MGQSTVRRRPIAVRLGGCLVVMLLAVGCTTPPPPPVAATPTPSFRGPSPTPADPDVDPELRDLMPRLYDLYSTNDLKALGVDDGDLVTEVNPDVRPPDPCTPESGKPLPGPLPSWRAERTGRLIAEIPPANSGEPTRRLTLVVNAFVFPTREQAGELFDLASARAKTCQDLRFGDASARWTPTAPGVEIPRYDPLTYTWDVKDAGPGSAHLTNAWLAHEHTCVRVEVINEGGMPDRDVRLLLLRVRNSIDFAVRLQERRQSAGPQPSRGTPA